MTLFRRGLSPYHTALAMIGAKPGTTVLVIGAGDPALAAEVALITGLNGRTVVAAADRSRNDVRQAADNAGALVDFEVMTSAQVPLDTASVDSVVVQQQFSAQPDARQTIAAEAARVVRSGGRVIAIEGERRGGLFASMSRSAPPRIAGDAIESLLKTAGLIAVRVLAEAEGVIYVEGRKT